jgi:Holliday junction resolvase RusA-like endonuclease
MKGYALTVYGNAEPAGSKRAFYRPGLGVRVVDANPKSREWKNLVAQQAGRVTTGLLDGPLRLEATFYRPRPASHFGSGKNAQVLKPSAPSFPIARPDTTKLLRAVEDALKGVWYRDDAQIVDQVVRKRWGTPARVELRVLQLSESANLTLTAVVRS